MFEAKSVDCEETHQQVNLESKSASQTIYVSRVKAPHNPCFHKNKIHVKCEHQDLICVFKLSKILLHGLCLFAHKES